MLWFQLIGGGILLLAGGEVLVRGSVAVASRLGVSKMLIGLTLVGFGTSTPELVASLNAALAGSPGIAIGNVVGSNIANVLLILGVAALILPLKANPEAFRRDRWVLLFTAALLLAFSLAGTIGRLAGGLFVLLLAGYTAFSYLSDRRKGDAAAQLHESEAEQALPPHPNITVGLVQAIGGIAAVIFGADLLVDGAISVARAAGISEALIGLTLVAVGTSLPELITSIMASIRRHGDVAFGNIVGSNIFNILGIAGVTALVRPIAVPVEIIRFDIWVMLAVTLLLIFFAVSRWRIERWEAVIFLMLYLVYLFIQISPGMRSWIGIA